MTAPLLCSVCGDPVDEATAHWLHEPGCPGPFRVACICDIWVHPECCSECAEEEGHGRSTIRSHAERKNDGTTRSEGQDHD